MVAKPKTKNKKSQRDKQKNSGLQKKFFSKIKQEYHDIDYVDQLNERQKRYLSKFMNESLGANLKTINPMHKTKKLKKEVFDANNARNRDIWSIHKAIGRISFYTSSEEALELWDANNSSVDEETWLPSSNEQYEDAVTVLYYHKTKDDLFSIQFREDNKYVVTYENRVEVVTRRQYLDLITDVEVIKLDELTSKS